MSKCGTKNKQGIKHCLVAAAARADWRPALLSDLGRALAWAEDQNGAKAKMVRARSTLQAARMGKLTPAFSLTLHSIPASVAAGRSGVKEKYQLKRE